MRKGGRKKEGEEPANKKIVPLATHSEQ